MEKMPNFQNSSEENKGVNRRDFLKIAGGALAYLSLPKIVKAGVGGVEKIDNNQENQSASIKDQMAEKEKSVIDQVEITPEFQRNMEKVLLSVSFEKDPEKIRKIYHDLLVKMPSYSIIQVLIDKGQEENFKKIIDEIQEQEKAVIDLRQRLQIISTNTDRSKSDIWAQDFGEMAKINGKDTFIVPADLKGDYFDKSQQEQYRKRKDLATEGLRKQGMEIKQAVTTQLPPTTPFIQKMI